MLATRPRGHDHEGREPSQAGGLRLAGLFSRYAGGGKLRTSHDSNDVAEQANPPVIMARVRAHGTLSDARGDGRRRGGDGHARRVGTPPTGADRFRVALKIRSRFAYFGRRGEQDSGPVSGSKAEPGTARRHRERPAWIGLALLVAAAFFMENLDGTIIATAAPRMARSFAVPSVELNVVITAYLLALGVFIPVSGWIADRFGARLVFSAAIALFTVSSGLCALSMSLGELTVSRVLQGMGGAMMVPVGRLVVLRAADKMDIIRVIAYLTWPALVAPVIAPVLGGAIVTYASWRWIFVLNLPLGLIALLVAVRIVPDLRARPCPPASTGVDSLLTGAGLGCLRLRARARHRGQRLMGRRRSGRRARDGADLVGGRPPAEDATSVVGPWGAAHRDVPVVEPGWLFLQGVDQCRAFPSGPDVPERIRLESSPRRACS